MPTIELISLGAEAIPDLPSYNSFAYIVESTLLSHRGLFQDIFDCSKGYIVHLGNKELEKDKDGPWFSGMLIDWDKGSEDNIVFLCEPLQDLLDLSKRMKEDDRFLPNQ